MFQEICKEYNALKSQRIRYFNRHFELEDATLRAEFLCRIDCLNTQLAGLQNKFKENFPDMKRILSYHIPAVELSALWRALLENSELCAGIELKIMDIISEVGYLQEPIKEADAVFVVHLLPEMTKVLKTPEMVAFCFEQVNGYPKKICGFVRRLRSESFSGEVVQDVKEFVSRLSSYYRRQGVLTLAQVKLLEICVN